MKRVLIPIAPGFEEVEALGVVDILRRAGIEVVLAGTVRGAETVEGSDYKAERDPIEGRCGVKILADCSIDDISDDISGTGGGEFDMIVLPGGAQGTTNLKEDERIKRLVTDHFEAGNMTGAICAAPTILAAYGLTSGRTLTSHPGARGGLGGATVTEERVVVDGNLVTSQGPGTALEFGLKLVEILCDKGKAEEVNAGVLARV